MVTINRIKTACIRRRIMYVNMASYHVFLYKIRYVGADYHTPAPWEELCRRPGCDIRSES
jgi:hypothetical protein